MNTNETVNVSESSEMYFDYAQREEETREVVIESVTQNETNQSVDNQTPGGSGNQNTRKRKMHKNKPDTESDVESDSAQQKRQRRKSVRCTSVNVYRLLEQVISVNSDEPKILYLHSSAVSATLIYNEKIDFVINYLIRERQNDSYICKIKSIIRTNLIDTLIFIIEHEVEHTCDERHVLDSFDRAWEIFLHNKKKRQSHGSRIINYFNELIRTSIQDVNELYSYDEITINNDVLLILVWFLKHIQEPKSMYRFLIKLWNEISERKHKKAICLIVDTEGEEKRTDEL